MAAILSTGDELIKTSFGFCGNRAYNSGLATIADELGTRPLSQIKY